VFVPLYDINPIRYIRYPYVTWALIAANVFVFVVFQSGFALEPDDRAAVLFGVTPSQLGIGARLPSGYGRLPEELTLFTYMFLHGGWLHLIGNMLFLWVFGDNVEDDMGHVRFLVFYLLCGIAGGLAHSVSVPASTVPLVGASGAIAGIVAAYLMLHPRVKIWCLVLMRIPLKLSASWILGAWIALQLLNVAVGTADDTAWWAHVGGLIAGALLVLVMRRPGVELWDLGLEPTEPATPPAPARVDTIRHEP
jgi:membrane associated rhomboid family serine protease